jgi:long-subunit acyl-CoA synthetase (AMP-forming)
LGGTDNLLLFLPLANIQQRTLAYTALFYGCGLTITRPAGVFRALKQTAVTLVVAPPSFYETVQRQCRGPIEPVRFLGPAMRLMLVGSAPVASTLVEYYQQAQLPLFEVYGMNEFGWIAFNLPGNSRVGSVGSLVEGVALVPQASGEIVVRGVAPQSLGYFIDGLADESRVYVAPNTIATGDLGRLGSDGRLYLSGRKNNTLILPAGTKVAPEALERRIEESDPRIVKAFVFLAAQAAVLSCTLWVPAELGQHDRDDVMESVRALNRQLPVPERVGPLVLRSATELTSEAGLLTENGKPNRQRMLQASAEV